MSVVKHKLCQKLVEQFCGDTKNWPREIKIAQKLLDICPNYDAWAGLNLTHNISSLSFFLTEEGRVFIPTDTTNPYLLERKQRDIHENIVLGQE